MLRFIATLALLAPAACTHATESPDGPRPERAASSEADAPPLATQSPAARPGPVLVELYTSQGCSSCPPADELLSRIGAGELGADVVPLAFHVDYWNYIGWRDPFSKKMWSERQRLFARASRSRNVYTPMLVVAGAAHVVGSDRARVREAIEAARKTGSTVSLTVKRETTTGAAIEATVSATDRGNADIVVVVTESGLRTHVSRGENSGRALVNDHIVRALVDVEMDANNRGRVSIPLDDAWDGKALKLVAFARDPATLAVRGVARETR